MSIGKDLLIKIVEERRIKDFGKLNPEWFAQDEIVLYRNIEAYTSKYGELPTKKVLGMDGNQLDEPYQYFYDEVFKRFIDTRFISLADDLNKKKSSGDSFGMLNSMREFIMDFDRTHTSSRDVFSMNDMVSEVLKHIDENQTKSGMTGIPSGWPTLDEATSGFQGGDVYLILARPKMGKSITISFIADNIWEADFIPMVVSMEMKMKQVAKRQVALKTKMDMNVMKTGQVSFFGRKKIEDLAAIIKGKPPFYYVEGQFRRTMSEISSLVFGLRPSILLIDAGYLIKMYNANKKLSKWELTTEIIEEVKNLASIANIPIVISFQFNREVRKDNPKSGGFEHVQLADAISQIASVGIGIFEDRNNPMRRIVEIIGGREGETGHFFINWNWSVMDFTEMRFE